MTQDALLNLPGVYVIENAHNGKIYIGSAKELRKRWKEHLRCLRKQTHHNKYLQRAWNKYGEKCFTFNPLVICETQELLYYEQALLNRCNPEYNISPTAGSNLGAKLEPFTSEHRAKISSANKKHLAIPEVRERVVAHLKKLSDSPEVRKKISDSNRGRSHSAETRAKIGLASRGRKHSLETRRKISLASSASLTGHIVSKETREKISKANTGHKDSQEARERKSIAHKGKVLSPETRAKIGDANRKRRKNNSYHLDSEQNVQR